MKRKLSPRPWQQAEQAHRQRKALGRALHQARMIGPAFMGARARAYREGRSMPKLRIPWLLRPYTALITRAMLRA